MNTKTKNMISKLGKHEKAEENGNGMLTWKELTSKRSLLIAAGILGLAGTGIAYKLLHKK